MLVFWTEMIKWNRYMTDIPVDRVSVVSLEAQKDLNGNWYQISQAHCLICYC